MTRWPEVSMLALHFRQSALVQVNTLLLQRVLKEGCWLERLTDADRGGLTPLFWTHVNPYGDFMLDMERHPRPSTCRVTHYFAAGVTLRSTGP